MWDLTVAQPQQPTWRARRNLSVHSLVQEWADGQGDDPWRGIAAQVRQSAIAYVEHDAILPTEVDAWVTVVVPPIWTWHTPDLISGEFMVVATTADPQPYHSTNNADALQLIGCRKDGVAIDEKNRCETHLFTIGNAEKFDLDLFALSDFFLFSAGGDDCVHSDFPSYKW